MTLSTDLQMLNSSALSDAMDACGLSGALSNIKPLSPGIKLFGPAYTLQYQPYEKAPDVFQGAANYIDAVPSGAVIVIDNGGRTDCTVWGDILTRVAQKKLLSGTVVHGVVRDVASIRAAHYPVFCEGIYMRSGKNRVYKTAEQCLINIYGVTIHPGDMMFADDNGVLCIPAGKLEEVVEKAKNIQVTEARIIAAVEAGEGLEQARKKHHYDKPWHIKK